MAEVQMPSGLWVSSRFEDKADRAQRASVTPNLTGDQVESKFRTYSQFLEAIKIDWVYSCVSLIGYSFASNRWNLDDADEEPLEDDSDPLLQLMAKPNPVQTGFQFLELAAHYLELTGNVYITLESRNGMGQPRELYMPNPARMRVIPDPDTFVRGYVYDATGMWTGSGGRRLIPYKPDEVIHIKWANPLDNYYGLGNIEASAELLDIVQSMGRQEKGYWSSGGRIVGTLQTDQTLTVDEFDQLVDQWARANRDAKQRARVAVLQKGVKFSPIAEGLRGLDLVNIEKGKRDRILAVFGVPLPKLGIMEQAQYKQEDADRTFHGETMQPKFVRWEDGIQSLVDLYHPDRHWAFERRNFEDDTSKLANANTMAISGLFTVDEARVYFGAEPLPDGNGNVLLINSGYSVVPLDQLGELGEQTLAPPEPTPEAATLPPPTPSVAPPMRPGNGPAVADAALAAAQDDGESVSGKSLTAAERGQIEADAQRRQRLAAAVQRVRAKSAVSPLERLRQYDGKAARIGRKGRRLAHPAIAAAAERGAERARHDAVAAFLPKLRDAFRAQQKHIVQPKRLQAILRAEKPVEALTAAWDASPVQDALTALHSFAAERGRTVATSLLPVGKKDAGSGWADLDFGERIVGIDDTTRQAVSEQITEGLRRGYSPLQIAEGFDEEGYPGIAGVFSAAQDWRAETISRTETMFAYQAAADARYREAGVDKVQLLDGTAFDEECAERDGTVVGIDDVPEDHPNGTLTTAPWFDDSPSSDETPDE